MIKLITPPGMLFVTAVLSIYAAHAFLIGTAEDSATLLLGGVAAAIAVYGAAMVRPWSKILVFLLSGGYALKLALSMYSAWQAGFFAFQFDSARPLVLSLLPGVVMALLGAACCIIVQRQFAQPVEH